MQNNTQPKHCALLIIDVQQGLFERSTPIYQADSLLSNINTLIKAARNADVPIVFIQHSNDSFLLWGSPGWQLNPRLNRLSTNLIIHKKHGNAFLETNLEQILKERNIQHLVICGLVTHGCVRATVEGALECGFLVTLVKDGHSSFSKQAKKLIAEWNTKLATRVYSVESTAEISWV